MLRAKQAHARRRAMQTYEKQARLRAAQSFFVPADSANTPAGRRRPEALLSHKNEAYLRIRPIPP